MEKEAKDPFRFMNEEATLTNFKDKKYSDFIEWGKSKGAILDKIIYPAGFGPSGTLLGVAVAQNILPGDMIFKIPVTMRADIEQVMHTEIGGIIKSLGVEDDEMAMGMYVAYERTKGKEGEMWWSWQTATPADLPMIW